MAKVPVKDKSKPAAHITGFGKGVKTIEQSDGGKGTRVDHFEGGRGRPDGPDHSHYWANTNSKGETTQTGGERRS